MERRFVTVNGRQVHYARAGRGLPVVLLHASPGDWRPLRELAAELARSFTVYALDTPGHGGSDPLPAPDPDMAGYGAALGETLTALGLERVHLYGTHTGAKIALSLAAARPELVVSLVLDGVGVSTPEERADQLAHYLPPVEPRSDGGHLVAAWHQVRNMFLYWPWYDERAASRLTAVPPPASYLHEVTTGLLEAGANYPLAYRAAFTCDPVPLLARLTVPTLVLASPADPPRPPGTPSRTPAAAGNFRLRHPGTGVPHPHPRDIPRTNRRCVVVLCGPIRRGIITRSLVWCGPAQYGRARRRREPSVRADPAWAVARKGGRTGRRVRAAVGDPAPGPRLRSSRHGPARRGRPPPPGLRPRPPGNRRLGPGRLARIRPARRPAGDRRVRPGGQAWIRPAR
ncbi:alpha/beta fold hydrolase [Nonomuraea ferruginea]|uniref:alpha/beta fold hydrolase n=1 Tax=Nonomuraea ferruginea TaxID=46174 RepID=UPI0036241D48